MVRNIPLYVLTVALLSASVYLRSPVIAISIVALWGVNGAENVFTRKNKDADISEIQTTLAAHKVKMDLLTKDITSVAERAKNILGEIY